MPNILDTLLTEYENAELALLAIIKNQTLEGVLEEPDIQLWSKQKLANIQKVKAELIDVILKLKPLDETAKKALINEYLSGGKNIVEGFIGTNVDAVNKLAADYTGLLTNSRYQILRSSLDIYRKVIAETSLQGVLGIDTRLTVAKRSLAKFAGNGITGFETKDGRHYDIISYTEMATRTAINNAFREGRIAGIEESGKDLIIVSSVPNPSDICKPWERKVLSISGKTDGYPSLASAKEQLLFHPNCRHSFTLYIPGVTEIEKSKEPDYYSATQEQRKLERDIRKYKRILAVDENNSRAANKIKEKRQELKQLVEDNNLVRKSNRESIIQAR